MNKDSMNHSRLTFISQLGRNLRVRTRLFALIFRVIASSYALFYRGHLDRGKQPRGGFSANIAVIVDDSFRVVSARSPVESIGVENAKMLIGGFRGCNLAIVKIQ